uniref:Uncharacterized protein n=1 Tax=Moniliophthora roreri TaxID=221103 RepID=A0A0W0GDN1_MONRR
MNLCQHAIQVWRSSRFLAVVYVNFPSGRPGPMDPKRLVVARGLKYTSKFALELLSSPYETSGPKEKPKFTLAGFYEQLM